jgi:hypothetical protein
VIKAIWARLRAATALVSSERRNGRCRRRLVSQVAANRAAAMAASKEGFIGSISVQAGEIC